MQSDLVLMVIATVLIIAIALNIRRVNRMHKRNLEYSREAIDGMNKRLVLAEETLALNKRLSEQGDETIALLQAIKDNLEHRSIKN